MTHSTPLVDFHLHSTASDGTLPPGAVVHAAHEAGIGILALTDHDTVAGIPPARAAAESLGLTFVAGIEVSATWEESEIHVLGYGVDPEDPGLLDHAEWAGGRRIERMAGMVERLREQGLEVTMEAVESVAGADRGSLARPHLARALVEAGYVEHTWEAFDRYIGDAHPAYLPTNLLPVEEAIELIHRAGGIASWAHPPEEALDALLPRMRRAGLDGLEVHRPRHNREKVRRLLSRSRSSGLVATGGSDWHGPEGGELGGFRLEAGTVAPFLERLGIAPPGP
jgi:3',5'-nucleoside bisphosphate phosphatase